MCIVMYSPMLRYLNIFLQPIGQPGELLLRFLLETMAHYVLQST